MADAVCCLQAGSGARGSAGAMVFTMWTMPNNKNANKGLITAQYVGVKVEVPANFEMGKTNKSPEFLKKNPNGKVGLAAVPFMQSLPDRRNAGMCSWDSSLTFLQLLWKRPEEHVRSACSMRRGQQPAALGNCFGEGSEHHLHCRQESVAQRLFMLLTCSHVQCGG